MDTCPHGDKGVCGHVCAHQLRCPTQMVPGPVLCRWVTVQSALIVLHLLASQWGRCSARATPLVHAKLATTRHNTNSSSHPEPQRMVCGVTPCAAALSRRSARRRHTLTRRSYQTQNPTRFGRVRGSRTHYYNTSTRVWMGCRRMCQSESRFIGA